VGPGPVWTNEENLALIEIRSPDRPTRSQSLYRLSYPTHVPAHANNITSINIVADRNIHMLGITPYTDDGEVAVTPRRKKKLLHALHLVKVIR
jgi:hypothetical protein